MKFGIPVSFDYPIKTFFSNKKYVVSNFNSNTLKTIYFLSKEPKINYLSVFVQIWCVTRYHRALLTFNILLHIKTETKGENSPLRF